LNTHGFAKTSAWPCDSHCLTDGHTCRRQSGAASDGDDEGLSKSGRELQKLLRGAASDSEGGEGTPGPAHGAGGGPAAEEGSESVYEDDDDLDDAELDDDYLDRMVSPHRDVGQIPCQAEPVLD
jgi:hypothetical protein